MSVFPRPGKKGANGKLVAVKAGETYLDSKGNERVAKSASTWAYDFVKVIDGKKVPFRKSGYRTQDEAKAAEEAAKVAVRAGDDRVTVKRAAVSVGRFLLDWQTHREGFNPKDKRSRKPTTNEAYRMRIERYIAPQDDQGRWLPGPYIGTVQLDKLGPDHLRALYQHLEAAGARCRRCKGTGHLNWGAEPGATRPGRECHFCDGRGGKPLAPGTLQAVHAVISKALRVARERNLTPKGMTATEQLGSDDRPSKREYIHDEETGEMEAKWWEPSEARTFLEATSHERWYPLWCLALDSSARRSELLGLRWRDVDLEAGVITIRRARTQLRGGMQEGSVKGKNKVRVVDLDTRTLATLAQWKTHQTQELLALGIGRDASTPVFTNEQGQPIRPDTISAAFKRSVARVGVTAIPFHGLRHTSGSLLLAAGVSVVDVSRRMGHATPQITLNVYAHALREQQSGLAARGAALVWGEAAAQ